VKITLIAGTKMHFKRFYRDEGKSNTRVGDSILSQAARSDLQEFYLQVHHPLKV
jgi:hypothetical protein